MDYQEMLSDVRTKLGVDSGKFSDDAIESYLDDAENTMLSWMWPFDDSKSFDDMPERVHPAICDIAVYLCAKQGAEGETSHEENGTRRTYGSAHVPVSMFGGIMRHAGVPK